MQITQFSKYFLAKVILFTLEFLYTYLEVCGDQKSFKKNVGQSPVDSVPNKVFFIFNVIYQKEFIEMIGKYFVFFFVHAKYTT